MDGFLTVWENRQPLIDGFLVTLLLTVVAFACAFVLGLLIAICRVSPVPTLRWLGAGYVELVRNTPLTLVFFLMVFVLPQLDFIVEFRTSAFIALSVYTAAFVCEAIRSGINSVDTGQAEAARAVGMTFTQNLQLVVLPQAVRSVVPPLVNIFVALTKNSSVAAAFFVTELFGIGRTLAIRNPVDGVAFLIGVAVLYLVITIPAGVFADRLERKVAIAR